MCLILFGILAVDKQKKRLRENFEPIDFYNNIGSLYGYKPEGYDTTPLPTITTCADNGLLGMNRWNVGTCLLNTGDEGETATRRLLGNANPRTLIPPIIPPPITDIKHWGTDNYTIHSATNNHVADELYLSGYVTLDTCMCKGQCQCLVERFSPQILQNYGISTVPEKKVYSSITDEIFREPKRTFNLDYITGDEPSMIYDPRAFGHSDPKRAYIDKLLGQPKFYYDDINAARAPNYITRNKIDIYSFGETTGRLKPPCESYGNNNQLAVEEFHNSALLHRADLMQSLMNKRNGEMRQLREFPINTNGQRMLGGRSKI